MTHKKYLHTNNNKNVRDRAKDSQSSELRFVNHTEKLEINMLLVEAGTKDPKWSPGQNE